MPSAIAVLVLVIRTYDLFGVPAHDLAVARRVSADILRGAGVELTWMDCDRRLAPATATANGCDEPPRADEILMRIAAGPRLHERQTGTLGYAYVDTEARTGALATLYVDRIAAMATAAGVDTGTLMGRAMAHETGHLLLGTTSHQPRGLMRARWSVSMLRRQIRNDWLFSPLDAVAIRTGLRERAGRREFVESRALVMLTVPPVPPFPPCRSDLSYQPTFFPLSCSSSQALSGAK